MTFALAASRHLDDARHLHGEQRYPNADHLAGLAAECALKAIAVAHLGAMVNPKGPPTVGSTKLGHLAPLWGDVRTIAAGRSAAALLATLGTGNPFASWDVSQRYDDGAAISATCSSDHIRAASDVMHVLQRAQLDGVLS